MADLLGWAGPSVASGSAGRKDRADVIPSTADVIPSADGVIPSTADVIPSTDGVIPRTAGVIPSAARDLLFARRNSRSLAALGMTIARDPGPSPVARPGSAGITTIYEIYTVRGRILGVTIAVG